MTTTTRDKVATTVASLLPARAPLTVSEVSATTPPKHAEVYRASVVGPVGVELILAIDSEVSEAIAGMEGIRPEEALRPVLEAAAEQLGAGVLGPVERQSGVNPFSEADTWALESEEKAHAWFGIRDNPNPIRPAGVRLAPGSMKVLYDVEMVLTAEIGRTRLPVRDVLALVPGAVLELDRGAGSPADVMVNGRLVARGEIVVVDEDYAVRISEIIDGDEFTGQ